MSDQGRYIGADLPHGTHPALDVVDWWWRHQQDVGDTGGLKEWTGKQHVAMAAGIRSSMAALIWYKAVHKKVVTAVEGKSKRASEA